MTAPHLSAERRHLTILFSDLSGSTALAAGMEAEEYGDLLDRIRLAYRAAIAAHDGVIAQVSGDGVVAIFGHDRPREDDARRAVAAALDLHAAVRALAPPGRVLAMHSGIHAGIVLLRPGDLEHGRYEMIGDATNLASRLAGAAGHDEILVSEATLGPERGLFDTGEPLYLALRGRDAPVAARRVTGHAAPRTRFAASTAHGLSPFVGRVAERALLTAALETARAGTPTAITIVGPPGQGKTRLAREFADQARTSCWAVHAGSCEAGRGARPLMPFVQMLHALFRLGHGHAPGITGERLAIALADIDPAMLVHRDTLLGLMAPAAARPGEACVTALRDLFDRLAARAPLLLLIDDLHWIDDASHQVLAAIRALEGSAVLTVATSRTTSATSGEAVIALAPLTSEEADRTIAHLLPSTDPFARVAVRDDAGGNPLFLEELCHSVRRGDRSGWRPGAHDGDAWLRMLVESRFRLLPEAHRAVLRAAAVIGNAVPSDLLAQVHTAPLDADTLAALSAEDFLYPDGQATLRFKHGVTRDAIYAATGLADRRALHRRAADAIHAAEGHDCDAAALAHHLLAAGAIGEAIDPAERAGDHAMAVAALDRAQAHYAASLDGLDGLDRTPEQETRWHAILHRYGLACVFDPSDGQLPRFVRGAAKARESDDTVAEARALYWQGYLHYGLGDASAAIARCEDALATLTPLGDAPPIAAFRMQVNTVLGQALASAGEYGRAQALLDAALVRRHAPDHPLTLIGTAYALACRAQILGDRGSFQAAHADFEEALALVRGAGNPVEASVLNLRAAVWLWQDEPAAALACASEGKRVGQRINSLFLYASASALHGYARWRIDRTHSGLAELLAATGWLAETRRSLFGSLHHGWLTEVLVAEGRFDEARAHAARAFRRALARDRLGEAVAARALARAAAGGHGHRSAGHYLARAFASARARGSERERLETERCAAALSTAAGQPISWSVSGPTPDRSVVPSITPATTPISTPIAAS